VIEDSHLTKKYRSAGSESNTGTKKKYARTIGSEEAGQSRKKKKSNFLNGGNFIRRGDWGYTGNKREKPH